MVFGSPLNFSFLCLKRSIMNVKLFIAIATLLIAVASATSGVVHYLTEATFEHDTQAASGATTGNWFVMFKSEHCGHCRNALPAFESLASSIDDHHTNIAVVDCDDSNWVCSRFGVRSYPTFYLLSRGKMYPYNGARQSEPFIKFLTSGYKMEIGTAVPTELSSVAKLLSYFVISWEEIEIVKQQMPMLFYGAIGATLVLTLLLVILIVMECSAGKKANRPPQSRPVPTKAQAVATAAGKDLKKKQ